MTGNMIFWDEFPAEIRAMVLEVLLQDGCSLAECASVSREWQAIIEPHNFSRIKLTASRVADFGSMVHRNRSLVRYIWLCLELPQYDCRECAPRDVELLGLGSAGNALIATSLGKLFSTLSVWESRSPDSGLLLDISIYSPSDSEHWFKYLTFEPDDDVASNSSTSRQDQQAKQSMLVKVTDNHHGWTAGSRKSIPPSHAIEKVFEEIMDEGPFDSEEEEGEWWQQLPLVPAVTSVLLRQQTRRRWKPAALAHMFSRLPGLQEIHYEPWREWSDIQQQWTDQASRLLFESLAPNRLRRLVLFENFDQSYPSSFVNLDCGAVRIPSSSVSRAVANASLTLEHLSASFIVEASQFFDARELSWKWPNLTWLALTSRLLVPQENPTELDNMLRGAAAAAIKMPNLKTMELWNGEKGLASLFRYQRPERGHPAVLTWRGTWELTLRPPVVEAWDSVSLHHHGEGHVIVKELLNAGASINSHGDAVSHLKLSEPVVRPVSLRQIQMEHAIREGVQS